MKVRKIVGDVMDSCNGGNISLGTLLDSVEENLFGVLLLLPALVVVLPISVIPGVSTFCAAVILVAACHIFLDREELWLPQRIRNISFNGVKMSRLLNAAGWGATKIDNIARPRLAFMTTGPARKLASGAVILLAAAAIVLGFLPLIDIALMCPVIFFGLGACTGDGLLAALGWVVLAASGGLAVFLW